MKIRLLLLSLLLPLLGFAANDKTAEKFHPVKGVVVDLMAERQALLVKHEEVPGVMRAMTMMFRVDPAVLGQVKKGDALKAKMGRDADGRWVLKDVEILPPGKG